MAVSSSFEDAWRKYVNSVDGPMSDPNDHLRGCLRAASTLAEVMQVFYASFNEISNGVRVPALKKMLPLVSNEKEAKTVYALANKIMNGYYFPAFRKEVESALKKYLQKS